MCGRRSLRRCERVELPLEVMTFDVAAALVLALDGDASVFPIATAIEFSPEIDHSDTCCWYMRRRWRAYSRW
jgi:hypothetical protein